MERHPLGPEQLIDAVLGAWDELVAVQTPSGLNLVTEVGMAPRAIADLLEKLIVRRVAELQPGVWRGEEFSTDKDCVCVDDDRYSFEIKTTTRPGLLGNKSFAASGANARKSKRGYYLVVKYENPRATEMARVTMIRFGWLDQEDWRPQSSASGQSARVSKSDADRQLFTLYDARELRAAA